MNRLAVAVIMAASVSGMLGCSETAPVAPILPVVPASPPPPQHPVSFPDPLAFPAPSRDAQVYVQLSDSLYAYLYGYFASKVTSRYVLYDDGAFALQFASAKQYWEFTGTYVKTEQGIQFLFLSDQNDWDAYGKLEGNVMQVAYSAIMVDGDFNNGAYVRE